MLNNETVTKLRDMRLSTMAKHFQLQLDGNLHGELSFEERLGLLVDAEWDSRRNNRLKELTRKADFAIPSASLEDVEYSPERRLDRAYILRLGTGGYIEQKRNIIVMGATGSGKTFIACAFGKAAIRAFYSVRYVRLTDMLHELASARSMGEYQKAIRQFKQVHLLILDEWLLFPLKESEARDLLDVIDARHKRASTIFCSQFPSSEWHERIGETTLADAICDRIIYDSHDITIFGESMRKAKGIRRDT